MFRVTNNSRTALDNGVILTDYGFVTVGDLLPGQTAENGPLRPLPASAPGAPRNRDEAFGDGVLLSEADLTNFSYSIYDFGGTRHPRGP